MASDDRDNRPQADALARTEAGATETVGAADLPRGARLGRHVILGRLGGGGMGVVYVAHDPELDRKLAIKLVRPDATGSAGSDETARLLGARQGHRFPRRRQPEPLPGLSPGRHGHSDRREGRLDLQSSLLP